MPDQYADSDCRSIGNPEVSIRTLSETATNLAIVAEKESIDDPVSEFIRELIRRWEGSGKKLYVLAAQAGLARSMPSQIKARTSAASFYSATKLSRPLGYADLPELVNAAWAWWHSADRSQIPELSIESARAEALRLAHSYGVNADQTRRVLERFPLPQFAHKDSLWWLARFHEERSLDVEIAGAQRAAEYRETGKFLKQKEIRDQSEALAVKKKRATRHTDRAPRSPRKTG